MVQFPGALFGPSNLPGGPLTAPIVFFDDFITGQTENGAKFATTADLGEWLVTADTGGTNPTAQDNADGGWITLAVDTTTGDHTQIQLNGEAFLMAKGRRLLFQTRLKSLLTTADAVFGLSTATTDVHATKPADGIFAFQLSGDADLEYYADVTGGSAPVTTDTGYNIVADTWVELAFAWDGVDTIRMYADAAEIARTTTNVPLDQYMSPILCIEGNGAAQTLTVDYVLVVNDRVAL